MANRYWVGGTNTWNATAGTKWSATSGGAGGSSVPTQSDDVFFNGSSGTGTVTATTSSDANNLDFTGFTGTWNIANANVEVAGALTHSSGMTITPTGSSNYIFNGAGGNITFAGKYSNGLRFAASGGSWTLQDAFSGTGTLDVRQGTLNTNDKTVTVNFMVKTNTSAMTMNLGASTINVNGTGGTGIGIKVVDFSPINLTLNAGTSTINVVGDGYTFDGGGYTFNDVYFDNNAANPCVIAGSNTFNTLGATPDTKLQLTAGTTQTVSDLDMVGTSGHPITINTTGTSASISKSSGTVSCDYLSLTNCVATGGATFYAGANSVDNGGNTGWIFSAPPAPPTTDDNFWVSF